MLLLLLALAPIAARGAVMFAEDFSAAPGGWSAFGDASLFVWNPTNQNLEVTWDSSHSNSYFFRRLGTILTKADDFALQFDLRLGSIQAGVNPSKPSTFEIAVGLFRVGSATNAGFDRGTGRDSPHLVEWTYFPPADSIDATISPVMVSSNNQFIPGFNFPLEMTVNDLFHVALTYTASNRTLVTTMTRNGLVFGPIANVTLPGSFTDFRVDALSISSYNDAGDAYGSLRAHGVIDNVMISMPAPPMGSLMARITNGSHRVEFVGRTNWSYQLERGTDSVHFLAVPGATMSGVTNVVLQDAVDSTAGGRYYRVRADLR